MRPWVYVAFLSDTAMQGARSSKCRPGQSRAFGFSAFVYVHITAPGGVISFLSELFFLRIPSFAVAYSFHSDDMLIG